MTTRDPEWDEEARRVAYAEAEDEQDRCPGCGHPLTDTTVREPNAWQVEVTLCLSCLARDTERRRLDRASPGVNYILSTRHVSEGEEEA